MSHSTFESFGLSLCPSSSIEANAFVMESFLKEYKSISFTPEHLYLCLCKHTKKFSENKNWSSLWDSLKYLYEHRRVKLVHVEEKESGRGFLDSYYQHIEGHNRELKWYLQENRRDLWTLSKFIGAYVPAEYSKEFRKATKGISEECDEFLLSASQSTYEWRKSIPEGLQRSYRLSSLYGKYKDVFGEEEGYKLLFRIFLNFWASWLQMIQKNNLLVTYYEIVDKFDSSIENFHYEAYLQYMKDKKLFEEGEIGKVKAPWDKKLWTTLKNILFFQGIKTCVYPPSPDTFGIVYAKELHDNCLISINLTNESSNIETNEEVLKNYFSLFDLRTLINNSGKTKECELFINKNKEEFYKSCIAYTKDYWNFRFYVNQEFAQKVKNFILNRNTTIRIQENEEPKYPATEPLNLEHIKTRLSKLRIQEKTLNKLLQCISIFKNNLSVGYSVWDITEGYLKLNNMQDTTTLLKCRERESVCRLLRILKNNGIIKVVAVDETSSPCSLKYQLRESPLKEYIFKEDGDKSYATYSEFSERLDSNDWSIFYEIMRCKTDFSSKFCLVKGVPTKCYKVSEILQKISEAKGISVPKEEILVQDEYPQYIRKFFDSDRFKNQLTPLQSYCVKNIIKILNSNLDKTYTSAELAKEIFKDAISVDYTSLVSQTCNNILKPEKIIKLVDVKEDSVRKYLFQLSHSSLKEAQEISKRNKDYKSLSQILYKYYKHYPSKKEADYVRELIDDNKTIPHTIKNIKGGGYYRVYLEEDIISLIEAQPVNQKIPKPKYSNVDNSPKASEELSIKELSSQIEELKELIMNNNRAVDIPIVVQPPIIKPKKFNFNLRKVLFRLKSFFNFKKKATQEELKESEMIQL